MGKMFIRLAQKTDLNSIRKLIETAFSDEENKTISNLAADLSEETATPPIESLVAEMDNQVIGYVSYSPIFLHSASGFSGYILSPLAVSAKHQKQGVGSQLIKSGLDRLNKNGAGVLLVYGDPQYYGRFGFNQETGRFFVPPYPLEHPFGWTGMMLNGTGLPDTPIQIACVDALSKPELW